MLAIRCPVCGQPGPVSLATIEHFACPACGQRSVLPGPIVAELRAARDVVARQDAHERQFSGFAARIIVDGRAQLGLFFLLAFLAASPFLCMVGAFFLISTEMTGTPMVFAVYATAAAIVVGAGVRGFRVMRRRLAGVRAMTAAVPPAGPGHPLRCHICGGELAPRSGEAFTRCSFCHSDNLTDPTTLAALGHTRRLILDHHAAQLAGQLEELRRGFGRAIRALILGTLLAFPGALCCVFPPMFLGDLVEVEPYASHRYAVVEGPAGRCIAQVVEDPNRPGIARLRGARWRGYKEIEPRPLALVPTTGPFEFVGLEVLDRHNEVVRVAGIRGRAMTRSNGVVLHDRGGMPSSLQSYCLAEGTPSPVAPVPLR